MSVPAGVCPLPQGPAGTFLVQEGHSTCGGPHLEVHKSELSPFYFLCLLTLGSGAGRGHGPWGSASPLPAPRAKAEIPEILSIPLRKCRVWLGGCTSHKSPPPECGGWAWDRKGLGLSPDRKVPAERRMPRELAAPGLGPVWESGHVAGDGTEGIEQGSLHAGLQEQQVHVDLGHRGGLVSK